MSAPKEENKDEGAGGIKVKTMGGGGDMVTLVGFSYV
jgi:hypothetical protein